MKTNVGQDKNALVLAGGTLAGTTAAATATAATSLTNTGAAWTTNQWAGKFVIAGSVYAVIISNTATVLTLDRWLNPATPTGAAGATPSATATYVILGGAAPVDFMALTANSTAPAATDTTLAGEIATAGGGLIRAVCTYAHTLGTNTYTLSNTFTANGSDSLPVTIAKIGTFDTLTPATGVLFHETLLSATATLSATGDSVSITQTVTM